MLASVYNSFVEARQYNQKKLAVLIDPDKVKMGNIDAILRLADLGQVDYIFLGGSLVLNDMTAQSISAIREALNIPIVLFPGDIAQVHNEADAVLFLSLISGRNPELLIGKQMMAAPIIKKTALEVISTGYMLVDGGSITTAIYMSGSLPIPADKEDIAVCTAMAGELLGMKTIYMDAGSGAHRPIPTNMIKAVSQNIEIPLIIGGGIRTPEVALANVQAGADIIVVGNAFEKDPNLIMEISQSVHSASKVL